MKKIVVSSVLYPLSALAVVLFVTSIAVTQTPPPPTPKETQPHGKVLFKRDQDSPGPEKATKPAESKPAEKTAVEIADAERAALAFTAYDLDVHLTPAQSRLAVHAGFTLKNLSTQPLPRLILQISSALQWETFGIRTPAGITSLPFTTQIIDTDADHTGKATEAVVTLPQPLPAGATLDLTTFYTGEVSQSGERLERIGAPADQASRADWDQITQERIALRGFGNILWYPVAAAPVFLGDGASLFHSVGQTKLQQSPALVRLRLTVEYSGDAPDAAFFCGRREQLKVVNENAGLPVAESPGVAVAEFPERPLGFRTMSLFVTDRAGTVTDDSLISAVTNHYDALPSYSAAAAKVQPLLKDWLGDGPLTTLYILDQDGQPFEDDALLVAPVHAAKADVLAPSLAHSLSHAWFGSSHVWLDEGVAEFMSLLWLEQTQGRETAVTQLQERARTLALAEPANGRNPQEGQSLVQASDEVYYRIKSVAVLGMLRTLVGEETLKRTLRSYRDDKTSLDSDPKEFQRVLERYAKRDLNWFFDDWVYHDRGLPDLSIANVTPRAIDQVAGKGPGWLVAVEVRNDGGAVADIPVTVRSGTLTATERLRIPARSSASTRIVFEGTPEEVVVNDGTIPEVAASIHTRQIVSHQQ